MLKFDWWVTGIASVFTAISCGFISSTSTTVVLPIWGSLLVGLVSGIATFLLCWFWLSFVNLSIGDDRRSKNA